MPYFCKIFERIVYKQLLEYLETNNLLDKELLGFRPEKSTVTAGVAFIQNIVNLIDKGEKVVSVFLDLSRAFDSVFDSNKKMKCLEKESAWFSSYLYNRQQYLKISHIDEDKYCNYMRKYSYKTAKINYQVWSS